MPSSNSLAVMSKKELNSLYIVFVSFGIAIMSASPRLPDFEAMLHVNNGVFGTMLSLGAIGSFIALSSVGRFVHSYGVKNGIILGCILMYGGLAISPHIHLAWIWSINNILIAIGGSSYHVSINTQAFDRQKATGGHFLPKLHGAWSFGALATALIAFAITSSVSLSWHITTLSLVMAALSAIGTWNMRDVLVGKSDGTHEEDVIPRFSLALFKQMLRYEPLLNLGMLLAMQLEFATNDWATIYAHKNLGQSDSRSIIPYILFLITMIVMRFSFPRFFKVMSEVQMIKFFPAFGGIIFLISILTGHFIAVNHQNLAFILSNIAWVFAGIGCCFMSPLFFSIGSRRATVPGPMVIASLGIVNTILVFFVKLLISWVAQRFNLAFALAIPGVMLCFTAVASSLALNKKAGDL
jgi:MFS family permease